MKLPKRIIAKLESVRQKRKAELDYLLRGWDKRIKQREVERDVLGNYLPPLNSRNQEARQEQEILALKVVVKKLLDEQGTCNCGK